MRHFFWSTAIVALACWPAGIAAAPPDAEGDAQGKLNASPTMERVLLLNPQRSYDGYVESEDDAWVNFIQIERKAGQPMHLVIRAIDRRQVASIVHLDPARREELRRQIEQFVNRAAIEAGRMEGVALRPISSEGSRFQHYDGKWFVLDSTADEQLTRRLIVRVEQIFTAYRQMLAPRVSPPQPPRIVVFGSPDQYQALLRRAGVSIRNQGCFIEDRNVVAVGSDLANVAARLAKVNAQNDQVRAELKQLEQRRDGRLSDLSAQMRNDGVPEREIVRTLTATRQRFQKEIEKKQIELKRCDRENAQAFNACTRQMFGRLYHEAFHAYLENYVYPRRTCDVPPWLNEGLAVSLESGLLEGDTLRVDAPNPAALKTLKADLAGEHPMTLTQLLAADRRAFVQLHDTDSPASDRHYAYAWGLAYYLAFEKHLLHAEALDQYVRPPSRLGPVARFEKLIGSPLPEFEQQWRNYILSLR